MLLYCTARTYLKRQFLAIQRLWVVIGFELVYLAFLPESTGCFSSPSQLHYQVLIPFLAKTRLTYPKQTRLEVLSPFYLLLSTFLFQRKCRGSEAQPR